MRAVIIVDSGVQDEEYLYPYYRLQEAGIDVEVATRSKDKLVGKYGIPIRSTMMTAFLNADDFDAAIVPGGWESPEKVRQDENVLKFLAEMDQRKKLIAAICHGPQVLISARITQGRKMTCYRGMMDDLVNAGAHFVDAGVVVDGNMVTSPHYRNNPEFMRETLNNMGRVVDFTDVVVKKPWGHEFLIRQNSRVGVWFLHLAAGERTSLHSHPKKKTGLIVLSGVAEVSFLNGKNILRPGDKINIRNGVFHSTRAVDGPLEMIEVETPNDKSDIIRLEDAYGRSGEPYEGSDHYVEKKEHWDLCRGHQVGQCFLIERTIRDAADLNIPNSKIVMLDGSIVYKNHSILTPGDVVDNVVMTKFATKFEPVLPITALTVTT